VEQVLSVLITAIIALIAIAIAYRVHVLHSIVFGKASARVNESAKAAMTVPGTV
jgi:hypothetical protein